MSLTVSSQKETVKALKSLNFSVVIEKQSKLEISVLFRITY